MNDERTDKAVATEVRGSKEEGLSVSRSRFSQLTVMVKRFHGPGLRFSTCTTIKLSLYSYLGG